MYDKKRVMSIVNYNSVPKNANIINTLWVLVIKNDNSKKARVVAKGCQQTEGKDFFFHLHSFCSIRKS